MKIAKDIEGHIFGYLTAVSRTSQTAGPGRGVRWLCRCACGKEVVKDGTQLRAGRVKSCGACGLGRGGRPAISPVNWSERRIRSALRRQWEEALLRGRGVCFEWRGFDQFWKDLRVSYPLGQVLVPKYPEQYTGPDNYLWVDKKTAKALWG